MDQSNFNTIETSRKQGHHLTLDERGMIRGDKVLDKALKLVGKE